MFLSSHLISTLVILIFCCSHLCLNKQDIDPNSSLLEAAAIENGPSQFHKQHIDSIEKSDHNFYLPINGPAIKNNNSLPQVRSTQDAITNLPSIKRLPQKATTCQSFFPTLVASTKRQCALLKPSHIQSIRSTKVPNLNLTENCERPLNFFQTNDTNNQEEIIPPLEQDKLNVSSQTGEVNKSQAIESTVDDIIRMKNPAKDMLSFEEWRKKIHEQMDMASVQKKDLSAQEQHSANEVNVAKPPSSSKVALASNRARNFASYECGAKLVDSNSEADFVNRVLNEQTDEYMLNPCKTKNWFVIELCETIQPQYLELANFELYSSIPKEFSVAASEHYPARSDWSVLGAFTSNDVRTVQGFKLQNNGFVKYLKVELNSYYGSEHFCPISVIRVFGTSLFDEVERIDKPEPIDIFNKDESSISEESLQTPTGQDIFGSAKKAVYNIFMKALNFNVFNRILDNFSINKDAGASFNIHDQSQVIKLYSSFEVYLAKCESFFLNSNNYTTMNIPRKCIFLRLFFPDQLFDMLYTQYFIRKFINADLLFQCGINGTYSELNATGLSLLVTNSMQAFNMQMNHHNSNKLIHPNLSDKMTGPQSHISLIDQINTSLSSSILPSISHSKMSLNFTLESSIIQPTVIQSVIDTLPLQTMTVSSSDAFQVTPMKDNVTSAVHPVDAVVEQPPQLVQLPPVPPAEYEGEPNSNTGISSVSGHSKEAIIVRLSNRIKNLEKNISLMSTYLENLSVRYRIQMEEMQLIFNKTIDHLNNTAIRAAEKDAKQQENIMSLESEITQLKEKLENTALAHSDQWLFIKIHLTLMLIEFIIVAAFCRIFYVRYIRRFLSSLPRTGASSSNPDDKSRLLPDDSQLIAQSGTQIKKSLYRSKSLSDLPEEEHFQSCSSSPIAENGLSLEVEEKVVADTDCDISDKENSAQSHAPSSRPESYRNTNCLQSNIGHFTHDASTKKILKAVNN